jgi:hypothetical protein
MATMKTFIVLLERTLFTSWKTCLSRKRTYFYFFFISVSNILFQNKSIIITMKFFYPLKTISEYFIFYFNLEHTFQNNSFRITMKFFHPLKTTSEYFA